MRVRSPNSFIDRHTHRKEFGKSCSRQALFKFSSRISLEALRVGYFILKLDQALIPLTHLAILHFIHFGMSILLRANHFFIIASKSSTLFSHRWFPKHPIQNASVLLNPAGGNNIVKKSTLPIARLIRKCSCTHGSIKQACISALRKTHAALLRVSTSRAADCESICALGTWCSGITPAQHAGGPGFNPQCVHFLILVGDIV